MQKKPNLLLLFLPLLLFAIVGVIFFVTTGKDGPFDLRNRATLIVGSAEVTLQPSTTPSTYYVGDMFTYDIMLNTHEASVSSVNVQLTLPYTTTKPEITVVDAQPTTADTTQIASFAQELGLTVDTNLVTSAGNSKGGTTLITFNTTAADTATGINFGQETKKLATITLKANRTTKATGIALTSVESQITPPTATPSPGSSDTPTPTTSPTALPTPIVASATPTPTTRTLPTGTTGVDGPDDSIPIPTQDTLGATDAITPTGHPVPLSGSTYKKVGGLPTLLTISPITIVVKRGAKNPTVTITGGPANNASTPDTEITYAWTGKLNPTRPPNVVGELTYSYQFDKQAWSEYTSTTSATAILALGKHTFQVRTKDGQNRVSAIVKRTVTVSTRLELTSISPTHGLLGTQVTLTGVGFGTAKKTVTFGKKAVPAKDIVSWTDTQIVAKAPAGGDVKVKLSNKKTSNVQPFTLDAAGSAQLTSISPTQGPVGTEVTLIGSGFGLIPKTVTFGNKTVPARDIISWTDTQIVVRAPAAGEVKVKITNNNQSNTIPFALDTQLKTLFVIQGMYQDRGPKTVTITIKRPGTNFTQKFTNLTATWSPNDFAYQATASVSGITTAKNYTVSLVTPYHLRRKFTNVTLTSGQNNALAKNSFEDQLLVADFTGDNAFSIEDFSKMLTAFTDINNTVTDSNRQYDLNGDNTINIQDISLLLTNFTATNISGDEE